jgi:hypothetical protein
MDSQPILEPAPLTVFDPFYLMCIFVLTYVHFCYFMCIFVTSCVLFYYVCIAVLHFTLDAGLLARSLYPEGPATGHFGTGFSWFPCL